MTEKMNFIRLADKSIQSKKPIPQKSVFSTSLFQREKKAPNGSLFIAFTIGLAQNLGRSTVGSISHREFSIKYILKFRYTKILSMVFPSFFLTFGTKKKVSLILNIFFLLSKP